MDLNCINKLLKYNYPASDSVASASVHGIDNGREHGEKDQ